MILYEQLPAKDILANDVNEVKGAIIFQLDLSARQFRKEMIEESFGELSKQRKQPVKTLRGIMEKATWKVAILWFTDLQHDLVD